MPSYAPTYPPAYGQSSYVAPSAMAPMAPSGVPSIPPTPTRELEQANVQVFTSALASAAADAVDKHSIHGSVESLQAEVEDLKKAVKMLQQRSLRQEDVIRELSDQNEALTSANERIEKYLTLFSTWLAGSIWGMKGTQENS